MIRFPTRRSDGTLDLLVHISGVNADAPAIQRWISEWSEQQAVWERVWQGATKSVEVLRLADDFIEPPTFEAFEQGDLTVRLRVRAEAKTWKDWMARFILDFCAANSGASLEKVESA
jgi:hypothetical protein